MGRRTTAGHFGSITAPILGVPDNDALSVYLKALRRFTAKRWGGPDLGCSRLSGRMTLSQFLL
jgi:hypothetical protein